MIPEMDGWEVARQLKNDPKTKNIPLMVLTALTSPEDKRRAFDAGADAYLPKPITDVVKFTEKVEKLLLGDMS
jgi:two-component system cell cycle response regulator